MLGTSGVLERNIDAALVVGLLGFAAHGVGLWLMWVGTFQKLFGRGDGARTASDGGRGDGARIPSSNGSTKNYGVGTASDHVVSSSRSEQEILPTSSHESVPPAGTTSSDGVMAQTPLNIRGVMAQLFCAVCGDFAVLLML